MAKAPRKLGFTVDADENAFTLRVSNQANGFTAGEAEIFVGLAGTVARFLTALCAAAPRGVYRLDGVPQMRKRPMKGLIEALRQLGADIRCTGEEGFFPLEIHAHGLHSGSVTIDASESSQLLSALFMVAPLATTSLKISLGSTVRWPFVNMTRLLMTDFGYGVGLHVNVETYEITAGTYRSPDIYPIESDATAASYFLALPIVAGGEICVPNLHEWGSGLQGDSRFSEVIRSAGVQVTRRGNATCVSYSPPAPKIAVEQDFSEFSDTFLTLAAIAPLLNGPTTITGIAHTRKQETDRVAGMARELRKLGQDVVEEHDSLTLTPRPLKSGIEIATYGDHRFAMSFGILGCHDLHGDGRPWLSIRNPACSAKTFPNFFEVLESLRQKSLAT